jgi:hypothetical protein
VALLFLVKSEIPAEPIWAAFIAAAAELTLRAPVPPTRPAAPRLFPAIKQDARERNATCWAHGGPLKPLRAYIMLDESKRKGAHWPGARLGCHLCNVAVNLRPLCTAFNMSLCS